MTLQILAGASRVVTLLRVRPFAHLFHWEGFSYTAAALSDSR